MLAFDFGKSRIGVAVGNSLSRDATPISVISAAAETARFAQIAALVKEWQPQRLVVGRPLHPDGASHPMTLACERFARRLAGRHQLPVSLVDERYSSVEAERELKQAAGKRRDSKQLDAQAAAIILRQYWSESPNDPE